MSAAVSHVAAPMNAVLSAVGGIKMAASSLTDTSVMWISVVVLVFLFSIQRFGTHRVGYSFAPILSFWFLSIALIGIFNFVKYDPGVIKAVNPFYIIKYFRRNGKDAWVSLGGVILCLTGKCQIKCFSETIIWSSHYLITFTD